MAIPGEVLLHVVVSRRSPDAPHLLRVHPQAALAICLDHGQRLLVGDLPQPKRVAGNPDFGEADQFASGLPGFVDPVNGILNAQLQVEPLRVHEHYGNTDLIEGDIRPARW